MPLIHILRGEVLEAIEKEKSKSCAELSLTLTDTVLVPACVENFEMYGDGEVLRAIANCGFGTLFMQKHFFRIRKLFNISLQSFSKIIVQGFIC